MAIGANVIPHYVKAKTPELLMRKMLSVSARRGTYVPFRDPQFVGGFWYSWYDSEVKINLVKDNDNGIPDK